MDEWNKNLVAPLPLPLHGKVTERVWLGIVDWNVDASWSTSSHSVLERNYSACMRLGRGLNAHVLTHETKFHCYLVFGMWNGVIWPHFRVSECFRAKRVVCVCRAFRWHSQRVVCVHVKVQLHICKVYAALCYPSWARNFKSSTHFHRKIVALYDHASPGCSLYNFVRHRFAN